MLQGNADAIGTYYDLQNSGMDLQKTIEKGDLEWEENEQRKSFSESETGTSPSRFGSFSSNIHNRCGSFISRISHSSVITTVWFF